MRTQRGTEDRLTVRQTGEDRVRQKDWQSVWCMNQRDWDLPLAGSEGRDWAINECTTAGFSATRASHSPCHPQLLPPHTRDTQIGSRGTRGTRPSTARIATVHLQHFLCWPAIPAERRVREISFFPPDASKEQADPHRLFSSVSGIHALHPLSSSPFLTEKRGE